MLRYEKICAEDRSIICLVFVEAFLHEKRVKGADLVNKLEVPEMIQQVLESIRNR